MVGAAAYMVKVRIKLSQLPTKLKLKLKLSLAIDFYQRGTSIPTTLKDGVNEFI